MLDNLRRLSSYYKTELHIAACCWQTGGPSVFGRKYQKVFNLEPCIVMSRKFQNSVWQPGIMRELPRRLASVASWSVMVTEGLGSHKQLSSTQRNQKPPLPPNRLSQMSFKSSDRHSLPQDLQRQGGSVY